MQRIKLAQNACKAFLKALDAEDVLSAHNKLCTLVEHLLQSSVLCKDAQNTLVNKVMWATKFCAHLFDRDTCNKYAGYKSSAKLHVKDVLNTLDTIVKVTNIEEAT